MTTRNRKTQPIRLTRLRTTRRSPPPAGGAVVSLLSRPFWVWRCSAPPARSLIAPCSAVRCCLRCRRSSRRKTGRTRSCPNKPKSNASDQADAGATSGEKLVSREEQPVDVPAPANTAPRVVSTIPIFPDPNSGQAGVPSSAQGAALASVGAAFPQPAAAAPLRCKRTPASPAPSIWPPAPSTAPAPTSGTASAAGASTAPRKIHTVIIRTDQMGTATADASAVPPPAQLLRPRRHRYGQPQLAPRSSRQGLRPPRRGLTATARYRSFPTRTARRRPRRVPAPRWRGRPNSIHRSAPSRRQPRGGGYAVQVTSQRSEAGAQAEFRALGPNIPASLAAASRSSAEPISAPRASITAHSSAPLPRWTRRPGCARA